MASINKVILIGRLGGDPEIKLTASGHTVGNLNIATQENGVDKSGNKIAKTEWHRVVVWGKTAELCGKYLKKGSMCYIDGYLQTRSFEDDKTKQKRYVTEVKANIVQFLDRPIKEDNNATVEQEKTFYTEDIPF